MDIDVGEREPPSDGSDEPWLDPAWFRDPWLDQTWTTDPWPPAWAPPAAVPKRLAEARQAVVEELGRAVLHLRLARGWTQQELERSSGVDQTTISRLERGRQRGLSIQALAAILAALKTGRIHFLPPKGPQPTPIDLTVYGDIWKRAREAAARRIARSRARSQERSRR